MTYTLIFDNKAIEQLEKLPKSVRKRIFKKIQRAKENPHRFFEKLVGREEYKLRIGDYRVIADINDSQLKILVLYADHRKRVYQRLE